MKLLFTQSLQLFSEGSGQLFIAFENNETSEIMSAEEAGKEAKDKVELGVNVEVNELKKEVEFTKEANALSEHIMKDLGPEKESMNLTAAQYGTKLENIGKRFEAEFGDFKDKYAVGVPKGWMDNLKIGAVFGTVAFASKEGGMTDRLGSAAKWTAGAAVLAHPAITGGLAKTLSFAGKEIVAPGFIGVTNLIMEAVDNPMGLIEVMNKSNIDGRSISDTPIYQLLAHSSTQGESFDKALSTGVQDAFELRTKGLTIGDPNLNRVMDAIDLFESGGPREFDKTAIPSAAKFILQAAAHKMNEQEMATFRLRIHNREATPTQIRAVLVNNAEREVVKFFEDNGMMGELQAEIGKEKVSISQSGVAPEQLDLAKAFIDGTVKNGESQFDMTKKTHGIRRVLGMGGAGMALLAYVLSFLTINGVMKLKGIAQPETYKTIKNTPKKAASWVGDKWESFKKMFKKEPAKALASLGKKEKWTTDEQQKALGKLSKSERKSVGKKMDEWSRGEDIKQKELKDELENLSGDAKKEKEKEIKEGVKMTKEQYWSMFDNVTDDSKRALGIKVD